jgi:hypothetical protein
VLSRHGAIAGLQPLDCRQADAGSFRQYGLGPLQKGAGCSKLSLGFEANGITYARAHPPDRGQGAAKAEALEPVNDSKKLARQLMRRGPDTLFAGASAH